MTEKSVLLLMIGKRRDEAVKVQELLTKWGCNIKTRLGVHDGVGDRCSEIGLIMLEIVGSAEEKQKMADELAEVSGVNSKLVNLSLNE